MMAKAHKAMPTSRPQSKTTFYRKKTLGVLKICYKKKNNLMMWNPDEIRWFDGNGTLLFLWQNTDSFIE